MKHVSDRDRFSIVQKEGFKEWCMECGAPSSEIHECFGGYNRQNSKDYGLTVTLCRACHDKATNNPEMRRKYQQLGKAAFLQNCGDIEEFRFIFHRYYI